MASHRSETSGTSGSTNNSSSLTPNKRSAVWEYFETRLIEIDGVLKAVCKYCGTKITAAKKSGTNSLRNHIAEYCSKIPSEAREKFVATMKKKPTEGTFTFDRQRSRDLMVAWCIKVEVPFNKFDDDSFEAWMDSLQPTFKCIGRQTIHNDCVAMYERMKSALRSELQSINSRICFTSDLWTSNQKLGYICLTAHYIDSDFVLKKKIIAFNDVKYPHTGIAIEEAITKSQSLLVLGKRKIEQEFAQFMSQKRGTQIEKSELDAYLEEESVRADENFEILTWWKTNSNKYPVLSAMARDFLAIPLSTVSSESAFSLGGRILSDNRSSMTPQTLEALAYCKDWMYKYPGGS